jgi:hypothetical protein
MDARVSGGMPKGTEDTLANHRQQSQESLALALPLEGHFQDIQLDLRQYRRVTREGDAKSRVFVTMHLGDRKIGNAACPRNFLFPEVRHVDKECGRFRIRFFLTATPP